MESIAYIASVIYYEIMLCMHRVDYYNEEIPLEYNHTCLAIELTLYLVSTAAFHARVRGSVPGLGGLKETKLFLPHPRVKVSIVGSLRDREVACSASDRQGSNFESCVWRTVSSQSSHHPQEVLLAQFSLYVHKGGLKPDSFHFISIFGLAKLLKFETLSVDSLLAVSYLLGCT